MDPNTPSPVESPEGSAPRFAPPIPPAAPIPPRIPPPVAAKGPVTPRAPAGYRPPSTEESKPVYVDPRILVGFFACAILLLGGLYVLKNRGGGAGPGGVDSTVTLRAGDVKKNLSGADWASLSLPTSLGKDTLLKTGTDPRNVLVLADGSTLRIDRDSSLKIVSVSASGKGQKVALLLYRGRVFVDEGPESQVTVETKFVRVNPVGTRYAVSQVERSDLTEYTGVRVFDGTVQVTHVDDANANLVVKSGEEATAASAVLESPKPAAGADAWLAWNNSWNEFDKMTAMSGSTTAAPAAPSAPSAPAGQAPPAQAAPQQPMQPMQPAMQPPGQPPGQPGPGQPAAFQPQPMQPQPPPQYQPQPEPPRRQDPPMPPHEAGGPQPPPGDRRIPEDIKVDDRSGDPKPPAGGQPAPPPGGGNPPPPGGNFPVEDASSGSGSGSGSGSSGSGFGSSYPTPAPAQTTAPPGYAPGSEPKGPSGPVHTGY